ncbi:MAG: hypothetical protein GYA33_13935 [Thermogutta sp.]|nr:hypothetical protein [Thermogutta sp.]
MAKISFVAIVSAAVLAAVLVLDFSWGRSSAWGEASNQPFANSVEQRMEMIAQLRAIREALTEQNRLLVEQNKLLQEQIQILKGTASTDRAPAEKGGDGDDKR